MSCDRFFTRPCAVVSESDVVATSTHGDDPLRSVIIPVFDDAGVCRLFCGRSKSTYPQASNNYRRDNSRRVARPSSVGSTTLVLRNAPCSYSGAIVDSRRPGIVVITALLHPDRDWRDFVGICGTPVGQSREIEVISETLAPHSGGFTKAVALAHDSTRDLRFGARHVSRRELRGGWAVPEE